MAARAIVEERRQIAVKRIQEHAAALSGPLGIDAAGYLSEYVKGDAAYQEMIRTEQLAALLGAVRDKVAPASKPPRSVPPVTEAPLGIVAPEPSPQKTARRK